MHPFRLEQRVVILDVALIVDFDHDVSPSVFENPMSGIVHRANNGGLIKNAFVLAKIKIAKDDDHAVPVSGVYDPRQTGHESGPEGAIRGDGGVDPWLRPGVSLRRASLEIDREGQQSVCSPRRHGRQELVRVAFRVPASCVRIGPVGDRVRV